VSTVFDLCPRPISVPKLHNLFPSAKRNLCVENLSFELKNTKIQQVTSNVTKIFTKSVVSYWEKCVYLVYLKEYFGLCINMYMYFLSVKKVQGMLRTLYIFCSPCEKCKSRD
jgi:hypothetical protein